MQYCPKCGNNVDETMAFCPKCGNTLKATTPSQESPSNEKQEKQQKQKNAANLEIQDKNKYGFVNYLISGLILVVLGLFAILELTSHISASGQSISILLVIIGIIIIIGAIYVNTPVEKYLKHLISRPKKTAVELVL